MSSSPIVFALGLVLVSGACGGRRVGNEEYFAGAPLPPPEPDAPTLGASARPSATQSASAAISAAEPTCHDKPAQGFPRCDATKSNAPCAYGDIGGCLVQCTGGEPPVPGPCPTASPVMPTP